MSRFAGCRGRQPLQLPIKSVFTQGEGFSHSKVAGCDELNPHCIDDVAKGIKAKEKLQMYGAFLHLKKYFKT